MVQVIVERELIEIGQEWVCSECGCSFYIRDSVLTGLTLGEITQHVKMMLEKAFAEHACLGPHENKSSLDVL